MINCTDHLIISRTRGSYNEICWYYNPNPEKLKQWIMGTDSVPLIALATGEVMAFLTILGHFISCEVRAAQILVNFNAPYIFILKIYWRRSRVDSQDPDSTHLEDVVPRRSPIIMYSNIILRIGMFAASCIHLLRRLNLRQDCIPSFRASWISPSAYSIFGRTTCVFLLLTFHSWPGLRSHLDWLFPSYSLSWKGSPVRLLLSTPKLSKFFPPFFWLR